MTSLDEILARLPHERRAAIQARTDELIHEEYARRTHICEWNYLSIGLRQCERCQLRQTMHSRSGRWDRAALSAPGRWGH
jgi:hypothetical protein